MDYSLRYVILGRGAVDRWPTLDDALDQLADVTDVVESEGTSEVQVLLRTEPPQNVRFSTVEHSQASCTCGENSRSRPCSHYIAARLVWLQRKGGASSAEASLMTHRAAAMSAMGTAMSALVDTYLKQAEDEEEVAFVDLMCDVPGVEAAMAAARAMVGRASEAQLSRFLLTVVTSHLRGQEHSTLRRQLGTAITLGEELAQPIDPDAPELNAPALLELRRRLRRAIMAEDVVFSRLSVTYRNVCQALGELLRRQVVDPRAFASQVLADELTAPRLSFPVLGWVAPNLDPSGTVLFPLMLEELDAMVTSGEGASPDESEDSSAAHRLRAEIAYAAGDADALAAALEAWPDAPYGEFLLGPRDASRWRSVWRSRNLPGARAGSAGSRRSGLRSGVGASGPSTCTWRASPPPTTHVSNPSRSSASTTISPGTRRGRMSRSAILWVCSRTSTGWTMRAGFCSIMHGSFRCQRTDLSLNASGVRGVWGGERRRGGLHYRSSRRHRGLPKTASAGTS